MKTTKFDQVTTLGGQTMTLTDEKRFVGPAVVSRYRIITTNIWVYEAREPMTTHRAMMSIHHPNGALISSATFGERRYDWFGSIGSQDLPPEIEALPRGEGRVAACKAWRESEAHRAHEAILSAFPEAAHGEKRGADIEVTAN